MFGGGGMNPRKMQQMMEQMGIDVTEIDAESVTITTTDGEQLVFDTPEIVGEPDRQEAAGTAGAVESGDADAGAADADDADDEIPEDDIKLVASQAGVSASEAREALEAENGDLAAAISSLE